MQCEPDRSFAFDIEAQLRAAMMKVQDAPDTPGKLTLRGVVLTNATSAPLAQRLAEDLVRRSKMVKDSGATLDRSFAARRAA